MCGAPPDGVATLAAVKAPKVLPLLANLLSAAFSLAFGIALIEFVIVPLALSLLPLRLHDGLPRGYRVLAQSSKAGTVPHDYIALAGDSHAQGAGDWFLAVDVAHNPPFHSAHLIHERTGRDVITFGAAGASNLRGLVTEPATTVAYLQQTALLSIEAPDDLLFYFYEGNDLNDNLADLAARYDPDWDRARIRDPAYFRRFLDEVVIGQSPTHLEAVDFSWTDNLVMTRFVFRVVEALFTREWSLTPRENEFPNSQKNRARVGVAEVALPDALQAPALDLTDAQLDLALYVFDQAFAFLVEHFPDTRIEVVYLPSTLTSYAITSPQVDIQVRQEDVSQAVYPTALLGVRSDRICAAVEATAQRDRAAFVDLRPLLWKASAAHLVHGPRDWKHMNRDGQQVLAEGALAALRAAEAGERGGSCASYQRLQAETKAGGAG